MRSIRAPCGGRSRAFISIGGDDAGHLEITDEAGVRHHFRHLNGAPLNDAHFELEVNFLELMRAGRGPGGGPERRGSPAHRRYPGRYA